jgi:hypothetical protein
MTHRMKPSILVARRRRINKEADRRIRATRRRIAQAKAEAAGRTEADER